MSLIDEMKEPCVMQDKKSVSDGMGGFSTVWEDGAEFTAVITTQATSEQRVAEKTVGTTIYKVTTSKNVSLQYHDVFKRKQDGKIFRVTSDSDDVQTPKMASFSFEQSTAEEWTLPE